jgi:tetratricopeptide (TPR) repeat protein
MRTSFRVSEVIVLLLGLMLVAAPLAADWYSDYEKGVNAVNAGRYEEGIQLLRRALEQHPKTGRVRSGMFVREYYPYFYVGRAYKALGRVDDAKAAFRLSVHPDAAHELGDIKTTSTTTTAPPTTTTAGIEVTPNSTTSTLPRIHSTSTVRPVTTSVPRETVPNEELARLLRLANDHSKRGDIEAAVKLLAESDVLHPHAPEVAAAIAELKRAAVERARLAASLFMRGQPEKAIPVLEDALPALQDSAGVHLLLGWLYYSSYLTSGDERSSLAERAREQLGKALELDPGIRPDALISPRLVKLFHRVRRDIR